MYHESFQNAEIIQICHNCDCGVRLGLGRGDAEGQARPAG